MKKLFFLLMILSTSFLFSQESISDVPKIVIKLPITETLQLNIGSVTFLEVLEDSRCPKYVNCIWGGRAKVLVSINLNNEETYQRKIIIGELLEGETTDRNLFSTEEHIINVIDLYPLPSSESEEGKSAFELLIHIAKK